MLVRGVQTTTNVIVLLKNWVLKFIRIIKECNFIKKISNIFYEMEFHFFVKWSDIFLWNTLYAIECLSSLIKNFIVSNLEFNVNVGRMDFYRLKLFFLFGSLPTFFLCGRLVVKIWVEILVMMKRENYEVIRNSYNICPPLFKISFGVINTSNSLTYYGMIFKKFCVKYNSFIEFY